MINGQNPESWNRRVERFLYGGTRGARTQESVSGTHVLRR